ncbi:DNA methyltransferase, partial [Paenibacillus glucanolyticus]|uniref:DNA methyltransferase n=1 Tax=Paenibacillus glucanolyticus TaxID=59843 RepID=UPI0030CA0875
MADKVEQLEFQREDQPVQAGPVTCLGITFENDVARRAYFREELRKKLPELRNIEGFPIGEDEDIVALSDPPYYTACPNPWINDFIEEWEKEKVTKYGRDLNEEYHREPFATDISEGKNNTIYNAHSYHTKVPYKAIMRYILHYTRPGDIIFDGFSGSGMTGLASEMCSSIKEIQELGLIVDEYGNISDSSDGSIKIKSEMGYRRAILTDLSPAASFIAHNYNKKADKQKSEQILRKILSEVNDECGWAYLTFNKIPDEEIISNEIQKISNIDEMKLFCEKYKKHLYPVNYYLWSELYTCNSCQSEVDYWDAIVNPDEQSVKKEMCCPKCDAIMEKKITEKVFESSYDQISKEVVNRPKITPKKVSYTIGTKRLDKNLDIFDFKIIEIIHNINNFNNILDLALIKGDETLRPIRLGYDKVHSFYNIRTLYMINSYFEKIKSHNAMNDAQFLLGSVLPKLTKMNRYMPQYASKEKGFRALVGPMANTLYFPSLFVENNFIPQVQFQLNKIINAWNELHGNVISTQSSNSLNIKSNSIDYIFIDPPFGANIMYS